MPIAILPNAKGLLIAKKVLAYNAETGKFTHTTKRIGSRGIGREAGAIQKNGYISIAVNGKRYYAHRLAWWWVHGKWPEENLDHKNGKRADNRIVNLRPINPSLNGAWRHVQNSNNTSGYKGIYLHKASGLWVSRIKVMRKELEVTYHKTKIEAARAYDSAAIKHFGEYAKTNAMMGLL